MAITDEIPKSRITLTYRTEVRGEPEEVTLPFRLLIMGDLSKETSKDRQVDLDRRQIRRLNGKNLNEVMKDMNMTVKAEVPNRIDPENAEKLAVELPVTSMKSFSPAEVARNVPKVRALLLLKKLLLEVQANIDNSKEFRRLLRTLAEKPEAAQKLLAEDLKDFDAFKLPSGRASDGGAAGEG
ncbi:type VI secretion system contractile sheath small subunit [Sorangium sp. So ce861]|uniref:type VI secretion system contractile sheath small subunit n=1 Tax=Sorangium sp. So ce861 TaxID=3133323 RepID=UPI003F6055C0